MAFEANLAERLPLTETTFYILLSMADSANHGYGIMKDVEALSESRVRLSTGTLYGALRRLLDGGWIERVEDPDRDRHQGHRERKFYVLSRHGRKLLQAEVHRLGELLRAAHGRQVEATP